MTPVAITFDLEADCPGIVHSYQGIKKGLPRLLKLLEEFQLQTTFFVTGETANKFPNLLHKLAINHEIACHGLTHTSLDTDSATQTNELQKAQKIIQEATGQDIRGFRAPRLRLNATLFTNLAKAGFKYDSSIAWWIPAHRQLTPHKQGITEFPLLLPNVILRFPKGLQLFQTACLRTPDPIILYFHPSECVPMKPVLKRAGLASSDLFRRPDRWVNTGQEFLKRLQKLLHFLEKRKAYFVQLRDLHRLDEKKQVV